MVLRRLILIFLSVGILVQIIYGQRSFSREEVLSDLAYLKESLEEAHYDRYAYTTEEAFHENYEQVRQSITTDSLTILEATTLLQSVISAAHNGHTEINFPGAAYMEYAYGGGTVFPLELTHEDGKVLIRKNWSTSDHIAVGSEILSINNQPIERILQRIYAVISAERLYFKRAKLELISFPRLFWQVFGEQEEFTVTLRNDDSIEEYTVSAISVIEGYESNRNEIFYLDRDFRVIDAEKVEPHRVSNNNWTQ